VSSRSAIEWTETTWNPTTGCDRVSAGCEHCYALTLAKRLKAMGSAKYQVDGDVRTSGPVGSGGQRKIGKTQEIGTIARMFSSFGPSQDIVSLNRRHPSLTRGLDVVDLTAM
jgi:protein gp37